MHSNYVPAQQQKHLQFLDFNKGGDLIMGCSSLNTRYMTGSLWYYKAGTSAGAVTNPEACLTGVDTEAGVMDGRFVREDQVVVGTKLAPQGLFGAEDLPVWLVLVAIVLQQEPQHLTTSLVSYPGM